MLSFYVVKYPVKTDLFVCMFHVFYRNILFITLSLMTMIIDDIKDFYRLTIVLVNG